MPIQRKNFVAPNDPILSKIAEKIEENEIGSASFDKTIDDLLSTAYGQQKDRKKPVLVGLAAPQVGISKRIILVDTGADGHGGVSNLQVFINPEIVFFSNEKEEWYEGCYSTDRVCGIVKRPIKIKLHALNLNGKSIEQEYTGYTARIFQHEIDHLNGKEFITHITDDSNLHWVEEDEFPKYRDNEAWRNWDKKCERSTWLKIKELL